MGVPPARKDKFNVFDLLHAQPAVEAAPAQPPSPPKPAAKSSVKPSAGPLAILASQPLTVQPASGKSAACLTLFSLSFPCGHRSFRETHLRLSGYYRTDPGFGFQ